MNLTEERLQTACLLFIVAVLAAFSAYWLRPVLVPFVVSIFIVSGVKPILDMLEQSIASSRLTAAVIAFLAGLLIVVLLMIGLWISVADLSHHSAAYQKRVEELVERVSSYLPDDSGVIADESNQKLTAERNPPLPTSNKSQTEVDHMERFLQSALRSGVLQLSQGLLELFSVSIVVLIYVFFLLLGSPTGASKETAWQDLDKQIRSYLSLKTSISLLTGFAFGLALWLFGVPMAIAFGMLAFLLNYIPNIGPVIASLLPLPLILLNPEGSLFWMCLVIAVTFGIQFVSGNVIEPKLMGEQSDIHPIVVLLGLMFWGMLWGMVGMFLATPMTAMIRIGLDQFERTRPVAELMAGRFPQKKTAPAD